MGRLSYAPRAGARVIFVAALMYAAVFAGRLADPTPGSAVGFLYVLPVALLAVEFGRFAGVAGGLLAVGLSAVWVQLTSAQIGSTGYLWRGIALVAVGALVGYMSERLRRTADEAEAGARHFELSHDLLCTASFDGYLIHLNGSWERVLGWSREELMARPFLDFVHPDDRAQTEQEAALISTGDFTASFTNRYATKDGGWRCIEWSSKADFDHGIIHAVARDVTDRREADQARARAEERVREAEERFRRGFEDSAVGIAIVGIAGPDRDVILEANESLAKILGRPRQQLTGVATLSELAAPEDADALLQGLVVLAEHPGAVYRTEIRTVKPDGTRVWIDLTASIVRDEQGRPLYQLSQVVDIDARKQAEEQLRYLADHDPLSGVYNRRRFEQELERELGHSATRGGRGAILLLDVDEFKAINDTLGHATGDAVIARIGQALTRRLRTSDVIARLGGDEFAVLLRRVEAQEAQDIAAGIHTQISHGLAELPHAFDKPVTVSIGVASFGDEHVPTPDQILIDADAAMYQAKRCGGNQTSVHARDLDTPARIAGSR